MKKTGSRCLTALLALLVILLPLVACDAETTPADDAPIADSPRATPVAAVQGTSRVSLDDYLTKCGLPAESETGNFEEYVSLKELSAAFGAYTERLESVEPPKEVSAWHDAVLVYQRAVKKALDDAPKPGDGQSEDEYILGVLFPVALQHQPAISETIRGMDRDLVVHMFEAGCIDEETLSLALTEEEMKAFGVGDDGQAGGRVVTDFASLSAGADHTCGVAIDGSAPAGERIGAERSHLLMENSPPSVLGPTIPVG